MISIYILIGLVLIALTEMNGLTIDVVQNQDIDFGGKIVTKKNIQNYLHSHEKDLIFGKNTKKNDFHLVNIRHYHHSRTKRSNSKYLNFRLNVTNDEAPIVMNLEKSNRLIDDSFVYIKRYENSSTIVNNFKQIAREMDNCFYRNRNSALDICNGNVKGMLRHNDKILTIHPLPKRFGKNLHVIIENNDYPTPDTMINNDLNYNVNDTVIEPENDAFEPNYNEMINDSIRQNQQQPPEVLNRHLIANMVNSRDNEVIDRRQQQQQQQPQHQWHEQQRTRRDTNNNRTKRYLSGNGNITAIPQLLHIETAIFIDRDLYLHMAKNYPKNTESELIRFVLTMINGVQILYHHPSLGHPINFMLKRLEILHTDPKGLRRSSDIDIFLNSFCFWQKKFNPTSNDDILHFDHAIILTGLDLYALSKNGKLSSQVVGLAPVGGMCTETSSCTINEGKHFESVFVVAHEIGHNLGMRHDSLENNCDPNLYVMSPTLGSGKITWSKCSRNYFKSFLKTGQAKCLFDRSKLNPLLDHDAEGLLPGERFDADKQCMLKYGVDSIRSREQSLSEICRDLHCDKDKYTWTSHPSLEGTTCGDFMWCRSGDCVSKTAFIQSPPVRSLMISDEAITKRKSENYLEDQSSSADQLWSNWSSASNCESGCLYGESGRLRDGSTGLQTYKRICPETIWTKHTCRGADMKYESCSSMQCYNISRTTVLEFAGQICERAQRFDSDLTGKGLQKVDDSPEESCKVYCRTKSGIPKAKHWTFPDGTTCQSKNQRGDQNFYCVNGRCEKFSCNESTNNMFKAHPKFCPQNQLIDHHHHHHHHHHQDDLSTANMFQDQSRNEYRNRNFTTKRISNNGPPKRVFATSPPLIRRSDEIRDKWTYKGYDKGSPETLKQKWIAESDCYYNCMDTAKGVRTVYSRPDYASSIQLCDPDTEACEFLETTTAFSIKLCRKYQLKVRGLSGNGMQIFPNVDDPDRGCKVACQDEYLPHRFYLVNGEQGHFPMGTKCSRTEERYCLSGKCLKFNADLVLFDEYYKNLSYKTKGELARGLRRRFKRNFPSWTWNNEPDANFLVHIIENLKYLTRYNDTAIDVHQIDMTKPIHVTMEDYNLIF